MRLQDPDSGLILCAFCGEAVEGMVAHLDSAHIKEMTIINSNYQAPGNPVSRWILEVRTLPLPAKPASTAELSQHVEHTTAADAPTSPGASCSTSTPSVADREEAMCLDCCKPVDNRQRHLFVYHVKRPIVKCPLCSFSSNFDAAKVQAHIAKTHSRVKEKLDVVDQTHLYEDEIARWEERCYVTGPPPILEPAENIQNRSPSTHSPNEKNIANSCASFQTDDSAAVLPQESTHLRNREVNCENDPSEHQESATEIGCVIAQSVPMAVEKEKTPSKPEIIIERTCIGNRTEMSALSNVPTLPIRYPAKCQICARQSAADVDEFKRHAELCRANRPLLCASCPRRFKRQSDSTLHRRQAHEKKPESESVAARTEVTDCGSESMVASSEAMKVDPKEMNQKEASSLTPPHMRLKSGPKPRRTFNSISSSFVLPTINEDVIPSLVDVDSQQLVDRTLATRSKVSGRKSEREKLTPISITPPSPPLALRKGRRQCSERAGLTYDDFEGRTHRLSESPADHSDQEPYRSMAGLTKRNDHQFVKAAAAQSSVGAATATVKRKTKDAMKEAGRPHKEPKYEDTGAKQDEPRTFALPEPMAARGTRLQSSATVRQSSPSSTTTQSSLSNSTRRSRLNSDHFECSQCLERFGTREEVLKHEQLHNCYRHLRRLRELQRTAVNSRRARCDLCNEHFDWALAAAHIYSHCKPYKCSQCAVEYNCDISAEHFRVWCKEVGARCIDLRSELEAELTAVVESCLGIETTSHSSANARRRGRNSNAG